MIIKILESDIDAFMNEQGVDIIDDNKVSFLMLDNNPTDYVFIDMMETSFNEHDERITVYSTHEEVEKVLEIMIAENNNLKTNKILFSNNGIVDISNGKRFYMDSQSRLDILTTVLLSITNPELKNDVLLWKTPEGEIEVSIEDLSEALLVSMQKRKSLVGL